MSVPVELYHDKVNFKRPSQLPAGFLEVVQPMADWMMRQLVAAYDSGYSDGRLDQERVQTMRRPKS